MESNKEKWHKITDDQYNYLIHEYQLEGVKTKYTGIKDIFGKTSCFLQALLRNLINSQKHIKL